MLYLKELNVESSKQEYEFFKHMPSEHGFENEYENISYRDFITHSIKERLDASKGINLKPGFVPDTYYFLWNDNEIVGLFKIRHYLNDFLRTGPGHIGYGILPKYRNKGYASKGLALALEKCKKLLPEDETEVYFSVHKNNPASLKAQLNNQAYIHHESETEYYTRIKIR